MSEKDEEFSELFQQTIVFISKFIDETSYFSIDKLKALDPNINEMAHIVN